MKAEKENLKETVEEFLSCEELAKAIVPLVGNKENIIEVTHCITRLRFILNDESLADSNAIEDLSGVVKTISSGGQYQVVIGTAVADVYEALMTELEGEETQRSISDQADGKKVAADPDLMDEKEEPGQGKDILRVALGKLSAYLVTCMQSLIPVLASAGMIRTIAMVLGPTMLGWLDEGSGTYRILALAGQAGIDFLPILVAWSASRYLKTNTVLAVFYGAFLLYPGLETLLGSGEALKLYGLPVPAASYTSQVIPVMLIMAVMYLVEKLLKKVLPEEVQFIGMPILETLIMLPMMLCWVGPLGTILGNYIAKGAVALHQVAGPLSVALVGALFTFICATGMHTAIIATTLTLIRTQGYDNMALVGAGAAAYACFGVYLAYTIWEKDGKAKSIGLSALLTHAVGGVAEPGMFSLLFTNAHLLCIQIVSAFFGALYLGICGVGLYSPGISNFMAVTQFAGGDPSNFRNALIGCAISFILGFGLTAVMQWRKNHADGGVSDGGKTCA